VILTLLLLFLLAPTGSALAADDDATTQLAIALDTVWVVVAGILVFFMNAGFGLLETGLCRAKNAVSVLAKNFAVASIAGLAFFALGFGLMFADGNPVFGWGGVFLSGADNSPATADAYAGLFGSLSWAGIPLEAKFFFQACFAMAAASIVSGAVAERIKFEAFLLFSAVLTGIVYPMTGHWIWGAGWLADFGFWDFAGSTQVHAVGGWAALAGTIMVGPRMGRFGPGGRVTALPGHSLSLATAGGFILWLGWFGFNAGSTMAADPVAIAHIASTTLLASMAGVAGAIITNHVLTRAFDLTMMINGCLAGLVGITAGCAFVSVGSSVLIGLLAGTLVVFGVRLLDRWRIDDPVGAIPVHLMNGIWGTVAVGLFAEARYSADVGSGLFTGGGFGLLGAQLLGVLTVGVFVFGLSLGVWWLLRLVIGVRVEPDHEYEGLDMSEMRMRAYADDPVHGRGSFGSTGAASPSRAPAAES
jgi:Amt family ammonium transporter